MSRIIPLVIVLVVTQFIEGMEQESQHVSYENIERESYLSLSRSLKFQSDSFSIKTNDSNLSSKKECHEDGRMQINQVHKEPYCFIGKIYLSFPHKKCTGSGVLIGPRHILTAGHNIFDKDRSVWVDNVRVCLPFFESEGVSVFTFASWVDDWDPRFDTALIVMKENVVHKNWCTLLYVPDDELKKQLSS